MRVGDYCKHGVVTVDPSADVVEVARVMLDEHVGFVVVMKDGDPKREPVGVLTDRDLVRQAVARKFAGRKVTAGDVMIRDPLVAREKDDLKEVVQSMRIAGFRRVPVLTADGALIGVIAIDDAIDVITGLPCDVRGSIRNEQCEERRRLADSDESVCA